MPTMAELQRMEDALPDIGIVAPNFEEDDEEDDRIDDMYFAAVMDYMQDGGPLLAWLIMEMILENLFNS